MQAIFNLLQLVFPICQLLFSSKYFFPLLAQEVCQMRLFTYKMKMRHSFKRRLKQFLNRYSLLVIWVVGNMVIFSCTFTKYNSQPQYYYLRQMLGYGLCVSRSTGTMINISCALLLLPICRIFMTLFRRLNRKVGLNFFRIVTDKSKVIHISCAYTMVIAAVIHSVAHIVNAFSFSNRFSLEHPDLNLATFVGQNPFVIMFPTVPGITGVFMILVLCAIVLTSVKCMRLDHYNLFWYCHHLIFIFMLLLLLHPIGGILKEQINLESHFPEMCVHDYKEIGILNQTLMTCSTRPVFLPQKSQTCKWLILPLVIYLVDFTLRRFTRTLEPVTVVSVQHLPGSVLRLSLKRGNLLRLSPGQFIALNCPSVSSFEWHPFSVSSVCSSRSEFSVHVRLRGDWSRKLNEQLMEMHHTNSHTLCNSSVFHPKLFVDGPFGSPFEDVLLGPISICIAGGIGITPFASILHAVLAGDIQDFGRLRRLHLVWMCSDPCSFTWFSDLLCALHFKLWDLNRPDIFQVQLYLTSNKHSCYLKAIFGDRHKLLIPRVEFGRPVWQTLFKEWETIYKGKQIKVFSCGPASLNRQIKTFCIGTSLFRTTFTYHHESFS